ncbi:hypothetical protein V8C37DRAFT_373837 [Trichoderma ceciliae]
MDLVGINVSCMLGTLIAFPSHLHLNYLGCWDDIDLAMRPSPSSSFGRGDKDTACVSIVVHTYVVPLLLVVVLGKRSVLLRRVFLANRDDWGWTEEEAEVARSIGLWRWTQRVQS